ncbi:MAG: hypothetical protein HRU70_07860 [Phycisphaeraceae bacterium]|nr:MAG: hypothetical protein HRU70_07860 [Phycisphaeraceae bacterium]
MFPRVHSLLVLAVMSFSLTQDARAQRAGATPTPPGGPAVARPAAGPAVAPSGPVAGFPDTDALLTALESADAGLERLSAELQYERQFEIEGDRQIRRGMFYYRVVPADPSASPTAKARRQLGAKFDFFVIGRTRRDEVKQYIFDGRYYAEKAPGEKRMARREVVAPGETFDPLRLGEGPLPIPLGQRKADILSRYDAAMLPPEADLEDPVLRAFVKDAVQLKLIPKSDTDDLREVRLWYRRGLAGGPHADRLLLRMARTLNRTGDESVLQFINVKVNAEATIPADALDTSPPPADWEFHDQEYRAPRGPAPEMSPVTPDEPKQDPPSGNPGGGETERHEKYPG